MILGLFAKIKKNSSGQTLIELVVVFSVIAVISAIILVASRSSQRQTTLRRQAQKLVLDIARAENFALATRVFQNTIPCGYGVHFTTGQVSQSYILFADRDAADPKNCSNRDFQRAANGSEDVETLSLESGIVISSATAVSDIVFTPPDPMVNFNPSGNEAVIFLQTADGSSTRKVKVTKLGQIRVE